ncbi:hypothetical protein K1Y78_41240 [Streptomyces sp. tea 10]|nr:hypothetical protein [Streptomyces sp. tea 10]
MWFWRIALQSRWQAAGLRSLGLTEFGAVAVRVAQDRLGTFWITLPPQ